MNDKELMIEEQLMGRDIHDKKVLDAMRAVDRELFVPDQVKAMAYDDTALPIGREQTISQPYIVAYMAQVMELQADYEILEVGSGCGYNAAVLSRLVSHVYSLEIVEWLAEQARENLEKAGIPNVTIRFGDGFQGWPEKAPFDRIMLTAATHYIPDPLKEQLKTGGKILAPVTDSYQKLVLIEKKSETEFEEHNLIPVRFVPMTGGTEKPEKGKRES